MNEALARILGSNGALGVDSDAMGADLSDDELTPYLDDDKGHD